MNREAEFLYFFVGMFFLYILPLLVIVFTYGGIVWHLHSKRVAAGRQRLGRQEDQNGGRYRLIRSNRECERVLLPAQLYA